MDSMRSLNTSLPGTSPPKQQANEPPEQLLQAFKAAALSVTKLYKTAAADQVRARSEGYQDALDELLAFLDKEDIGLSDGEGWRIRRWATERLDGRDGRDTVSQHMESDDESGEKVDLGSSPEIHRSQSTTQYPSTNRATRTASPARAESMPLLTPTSHTTLEDSPSMIPPQGQFTFRSAQTYPQDSDMTLSDLNLSDNNRVDGQHSNPSSTFTISRPSRPNQRHNNHPTRLSTRSSTSLGKGIGQKRKLNIGDVAEYFDLSNFGNGKDTCGGGGKRGRFV